MLRTNTLSELVNEISHAEKGLKILEQIWIEVGPYNQNKVSEETLNELNKFFEFDDSE